MKYDFKTIESKWQKKWAEKKLFAVKKGKKKKFYILEMFPYPSGSKLHMGHAFNYIIGDIYSRFKRMQGFNVLYPMGYDSFGLPAENAAIKEGKHPRITTENSTNNYTKQLKGLGISYDWNRTLSTHMPEYYKWNQFFFLKFLEKGLIYRKKAPVNFCEKCNTVLANEQVHNGMCWRHEDTEVKIKYLEQWFIKTTNYADELLKDVEKLEWPERIKIMQKNWIGKSFGTEIYFEIESQNSEKWPVFTTRPDTIFGVTFMVVSSQHPRLMDLVTDKQKKEVQDFLRKIKKMNEKELEKEGVFTGSYALNPINGEKIPVWVGNFVVADYGSGMVMAVPAHDQRDFEFAKKYNLPIKQVIKSKEKNFKGKVFDGDGILINSGKFNGLNNKRAEVEVTKYLEKKELGKKAVKFKLKDWLVSRQRYWGTPIPVVYCDECGIVPLAEKDLPIKLPERVKFGKGNPLGTAKNWVNAKCPKCGKKARRETDTMDTFFDSSWYFLRYCDNKNKKQPFDKNKINYWMPVDQYIGGAEHACMHLIYARFFTKALRDLGFFSKKINEPFIKLFNQGMLHGEDGFVMAKSRGNGVYPEAISKKYGIDTARIFLVSIASPDKDIQWSSKGIEGSSRFINKIMDYFNNFKQGKSSRKIESKINKTIKGVTEDIENFKYNLAIIKLRKLFESFDKEISKKHAEIFLKLLHPFCPHITEELWGKIKNNEFISLTEWPKSDEKKIDESLEKHEKAVEKLIKDINHVIKIIKAKGQKIKKIFVYTLPKEKSIFIENKFLISQKIGIDVEIFAVNDKSKSTSFYDPKGFAKKAKPGKPALYLE